MLNWLLSNPIYFGIYFVFIWLFVHYSLSKISGWAAIAKRYRRQNVTHGKLYPFVGMDIGEAMQSGTLFVRVGNEGLDISVFLLFRLFHPPLLIPWNAFDSCKRTRLFSTGLFSTERLQLTLKELKCVLCFRGALADEIEKCYHEFATK
jgi:hypothetical protein